MAKSETIKNEDIWQKDKLGIKQHVTSFANILKQEKYVENGTSKVYSISAEFGVGKTFFCERLADILEQDDVPVSMLNIWKMDFYDNPLVPLLIKLEETYSQQSETVRTKKFPNPDGLLRVAKSIAEDSKRIISDAQKQADAKVKEVENKIEKGMEKFVCPECKNEAIIPTGGCGICLQCGYSKCN